MKKERMRYAARYMQGVQAVCNRDMNFFPRVVVMRVTHGNVQCADNEDGCGVGVNGATGRELEHARVHARDVSIC
jgi:hypothetical protein